MSTFLTDNSTYLILERSKLINHYGKYFDIRIDVSRLMEYTKL